jgi:hypothetical protein
MKQLHAEDYISHCLLCLVEPVSSADSFGDLACVRGSRSRHEIALSSGHAGVALAPNLASVTPRARDEVSARPVPVQGWSICDEGLLFTELMKLLVLCRCQ